MIENRSDFLSFNSNNFRSIEECSRSLASVPGCTIDIHHLLTSPSADLQTAENAFVGLCAVQIGLVDLLYEFGLKADGLVGHSVGELVCGYADGCLDIRQTILSSYFRGGTFISGWGGAKFLKTVNHTFPILWAGFENS